MPDDYARKNYSDKQYKDWLSIKTSKSVWNQILEENPGVAEFSRLSRSAPLGRSIQRYIQQSEFKKPYLDNDFVNMENEWEGPGNGTQYRPGTFDNPYNLVDPDPGSGSGHWVLMASASGNYCENTTEIVLIHGSHPIYNVAFTFPGLVQDLTFTIVGGIGTTLVILEFTAGANPSPLVSMEAYLEAFDAIPLPSTQGRGWTGFSVSESCEEEVDCDGVDPLEISAPATIGQDESASVTVSGGAGPYSWSASGTGFSFEDPVTSGTGNTLIADDESCGTCHITVTDSCEQSALADTLGTEGSWQDAGPGCLVGGSFDEEDFRVLTKEAGGKRSVTSYGTCFLGNPGECSTNCGTGCGGQNNCVTASPFCAWFWMNPQWIGDFPCCDRESSGPPGPTPCSDHSAVTTNYTWEC